MPLPFRPRTRALVLAPILAIALMVVPAEALNIVRWVAVAAAIAWLVVAFLSKDEKKASDTDGMQGQSKTMRVRTPSTGAALVVGVDGLGEDPDYIPQVIEAISKAVRAGDKVESIGNGRFAVFLTAASPNHAEAIGLRICESVEDLILFGNGNRLKLISASVGGVIHANEDPRAGLATAVENLVVVQRIPTERLLISVVA